MSTNYLNEDKIIALLKKTQAMVARNSQCFKWNTTNNLL